jgi:hypothetical protein
MRLSDFTTSRELHRTRLYNDTFRPLGIEYLVSVSTPIGRGAQVAMVFTRKHRDFDERELCLVRKFLPHFAQAYRNAESVSCQRLNFEEGLGVLERYAQASTILLHDMRKAAASPQAELLVER